jgi:hypothetical protein
VCVGTSMVASAASPGGKGTDSYKNGRSFSISSCVRHTRHASTTEFCGVLQYIHAISTPSDPMLSRMSASQTGGAADVDKGLEQDDVRLGLLE